ncbi:MAG: RNA polymerase sigma factor [Leptospiraceae bacterium]|nr:RNA polymerase sigma factor [Leptospiraceae bacterium]MCB1316040.1 RNA polymerase sigma factor [Leptospiraceae bacterium]MCB1319445.1 RNA polymerase sigma factor [Leptospiraceae bacterium]
MQDLLSELIQGNTGAWKRFQERYAAVIYDAVRKTFMKYDPGSLEQTEDVVQNVFLRLVQKDYNSLRRYDSSKSSPTTFLYVIARNTTIDFLRRKQPEHPVDLDLIPEIPAPPDNPEEFGLEDLPTEILTPRQRLVLHLLYDRHLNIAETARFMGVKEQTVRSAKHKAVQSLRRHYRQAEDQSAESGDPDTWKETNDLVVD